MWPRTSFSEGGDLIFIYFTYGLFGESKHSQTSVPLQPCSRCCSTASAEAVMLCMACDAGSLFPARLKQDLLVATSTWRCYNLPLQKPLTTEVGNGYRQGFILQVQLRQGDALFCGIGEVAPLPGGSLSLLLVTLKQHTAFLPYLLKLLRDPWSAQHSRRMNFLITLSSTTVSSVVELCSS